MTFDADGNFKNLPLAGLAHVRVLRNHFLTRSPEILQPALGFLLVSSGPVRQLSLKSPPLVVKPLQETTSLARMRTSHIGKSPRVARCKPPNQKELSNLYSGLIAELYFALEVASLMVASLLSRSLLATELRMIFTTGQGSLGNKSTWGLKVPLFVHMAIGARLTNILMVHITIE